MKPITTDFSPANAYMLAGGLILTGIALFRMIPIKFDKNFWWMTGPVLAMFALVLFCILKAPDVKGALIDSAQKTAMITSRMYVMLVLLFIVMGASGVVSKIYQVQIEHAFGKCPMFYAILGSFGISSPSSTTGLIETLWPNQSFRSAMMYFVQVNGMISVCLFQLRVGGFKAGSPIPMQIYCTGIAMAIFMWPLMRPAMYLGDILFSFIKR